MTTPALTFPLPDPCPICGGVVSYSGKGRRPVFCSPVCRRADRTAYERDRARRAATQSALVAPEIAAAVARRRAKVAAAPYVLARRVAGDWMPDAEDLLTASRSERLAWRDSFTVEAIDGSENWKQRARPRKYDKAAQWLVENHPEELADFPPDV